MSASRRESSLLELVIQAARRFGDKVAIITPDETVTYAQVEERLHQLANLITEHTKLGDRIVICMRNDGFAALLPLAVWSVGRVSVPLNWRSSPFEISNIITASGASLVLHDDALESAVEEALSGISGTNQGCKALHLKKSCAAAIPVKTSEFSTFPDTLASINFTSGTLGSPKGVMLNQHNWEIVYRNLVAVRGFTKNDVMALPGPLSHAAGTYVIPLLLSGSSFFLPISTTPADIARDIEKYKISIFYCVPTLLTRLIDSPEFCQAGKQHLRQIVYGAESIPFATLRRGIEIFGPIFAQNYGLTEAMMTCVFLPPEEHIREDGSIRYGVLGRPYPFVEIVLRNASGEAICAANEIGELTVRSPHTMLGYWNNSEQTNQVLRDGWIWSGDLARWTDEGYIELVGRNKDMIVCGGMNMYPAEVQRIVSSLPGVTDCAVFGVPSKEWGEELVAALVLSVNADETEICNTARSLLGIRTPKQWAKVDELPRTLNGKTDIPALKSKLAY